MANHKDKQKYLVQAQKIAERRKGQLLSKKYISSRHKIKWKCARGHIWAASIQQIQRGSWCPKCNIDSQRLGIEILEKIARHKGGKCLSTNYVNNASKLSWSCVKGHTWLASAQNIRAGQWCPYCARKRANFISEVKTIASNRGGKCLSKKYVSALLPLNFICKEGHRFSIPSNRLRNGGWCAICSSGISERVCRIALEILLNKKFPKTRPKWLINAEGERMELDGYSPALKIAFEHQGMQHYKLNKSFNVDRIGLRKRKADDETKRRLCSKHGIYLIEIPALGYLTKTSELRSYLISKIIAAKKNNKKLFFANKSKMERVKIDFSKAYISKEKEMISKARLLGKKQSGRLISNDFINTLLPLTWRCNKNHLFQASYGNVSQGKWCPVCARARVADFHRGDIQELKDIAIKHGGKLVSNRYINSKTRMEWICSDGHKWKASATSVKNLSTWCPICYRQKRLKEIALDRAKNQLKITNAEKLINTESKIKWRCLCGNIINSSLRLLRQKKKRVGYICNSCRYNLK